MSGVRMRLIVAGAFTGLALGSAAGAIVGYNLGAQATWALVTYRLNRAQRP